MQNKNKCSHCDNKDKIIQSLKEENKHIKDQVIQEINYKKIEREKRDRACSILKETNMFDKCNEKTIITFKQVMLFR